MNIHEYQAKELLRGYGVSVLQGFAAWTPEEAEAAAAKLPGPVYVVKSQIHAGGRGAGHFKDDPQGKGGVRLARSAEEVRAAAEAMIGHTLVTKQTGPAGRDVRRVYVEAGCDIARELYLSLLVDRDTSRVLIMASTEGGMEVEEVAENHPEKILRVAVDPATGIFPYHARKLAFGLGLQGKQIGAFSKFVDAMYKAFVALDCAIVEINPLVVTKAGEVVALDAKVSFDDNALVPPRRTGRPARRGGGGPQGAGGRALRPELRGAGRRDRLHGERRRPWRWRRWTSSSSTAARPPTSSMSAVAPRGRR